MKKKLVLENGKVFIGEGFGSNEEKIAEIVFNTSMVGYQEILSDPSYCDQIVVMSYPLIGNYGLAEDDYESKEIFLSGFIVNEYNDKPSNFRFTKTLAEEMEDTNVSGIYGIDTRELVKIIRDNGAMKAIITDIELSDEDCLNKLNAYQFPTNQLKKVSTKKAWISRTRNPLNTVVAIDCGCKLNIVRKLNEARCNVIVLPYTATYNDVIKYNPDGVFISNGPGDPVNAESVINLVKDLKGKLPILGICLGHQIIALAYGAQTYKMKFGHRGANHPVKNLLTDKVEITSQNHSYAIDTKTLVGTGLELTHINLLDNEAEGIMDKENDVISVQYHPESAAGPEDSEYIFKKFIDLMNKGVLKNAKKN